MKKAVIILSTLFCIMGVFAQPRPFETDPSFLPSLEYMQKSWSGEYDGLEPNSRMIISIKRSLTLNADSTYTNEVRGQVKNETTEVLLKTEAGTYDFDVETGLVTYALAVDSTLDINNYLQGKEVFYVVNHYKRDGEEKYSNEKAQFTRADNDSDRQWVLFDPQLKSPIDQRQQAVYVMVGKDIVPSNIPCAAQVESNKGICYDISGRRVEKLNRGVYIVGRKKVSIR